MRALPGVESLWGNMEKIARAIADELAKRLPLDLVSVDDAPTVDDYDLVVVSGPTPAFSMTRPVLGAAHG